MKRFTEGLSSVIVVLALGAACAAPDNVDDTHPRAGAEPMERSEELRWLQRFEGEWVFESTLSFGEGATSQAQGRMTSRRLGEHWIVSEWTMQADGETVTAFHTLGFDAAQGRYVASWVDSLTSHLWSPSGTREGDTLTLQTEGPSHFAPGEQAQYRDVYEFLSDDRLVQTSLTPGPDGDWVEYMRSEYRRE